jgi:hypothetical protein
MYLVLFALVVAGVVWSMERLGQLRGSSARRQLESTPDDAPVRPGRLSERATLAYGAEAGPGELQLTPSQLVFTADSGRVVVLERLDLVGVNVTTELPDQTLVSPVLVVTVGHEAYYFAVASPTAWAMRLLG